MPSILLVLNICGTYSDLKGALLVHSLASTNELKILGGFAVKSGGISALTNNK